MLQEFEQTQAVVRSSVSKASTISDEEHWLELTEDDFIVIQWKMDKIDQKLNDLHRNSQAEYKNVVTQEVCNEVKIFYKPFLEKYESKYRILYQMLQQKIDKQILLICHPLGNKPLILLLVWLH